MDAPTFSGERIYLVGAVVSVTAASSVTLACGSTVLPMDFAAAGTVALPLSPEFPPCCAPNTALTVAQTGSGGVRVSVGYLVAP